MNDRFYFRVWCGYDGTYFCFSLWDIKKYTLEGINPDDIEQCTGLKDKNGKLIYEGDIVKYYGLKDNILLVCKFNDGYFHLDHLDGRPFNYVSSVKPIEVIGNIHEKAELIK